MAALGPRGIGLKASKTGQQRARRAHGHRAASFALSAVALLGAFALAYVGFMLWPRWPAAEAATNAPSIPIEVAGLRMNVPPAAIRVSLQRRPGNQPRLDLAYRWPDLKPPIAGEKLPPSPDAKRPEQLFVSVVPADGTLPLDDRIKTIYPRYIEERAFEGPEGLTGVAFRPATPYQGEDLFYLPGRTENFFARCTRDSGLTHGACLLERRVGEAMITARFPREWLKDWRELAAGLDRLMANLRGHG
ncbi:MAG: hypothetical protein QOD74_2895 [Variibacter sp.]|nr:hypothetical protein [Variibacter sp.]